MAKARLVVLASGNGSNLQAILDACNSGQLPAVVVAVISDRAGAFALERARMAGIPAVYHPWKPFREAGADRSAYDTALAELAIAFKPDYMVLAGWMRLLTSAFLERFPMRVVNLHPALPGAFPGTEAIRRAWLAGQSRQISSTGVMVHFVPDEGVDNGPVIAVQVVPLVMDEPLEDLEARIHTVEHRLLVQALQSILQKEPL